MAGTVVARSRRTPRRSHTREALALIQASALARGLRWVEPHVGCNERGQITLEWWQGDRALTLFVRSEERIDYLKSWGSDLVNEIEDGELIRSSDFLNLSHWLYPGSEPAE
jgi:hypothetical protein